MSRETKIGMVVAVSFLCLVGVVVATRWRRDPDAGKQINVAMDNKDAAKNKNDNPPVKPAEGNPVQTAVHTSTDGNPPPLKLPNSNEESQSPPPLVVAPANNPVSPPAVAAPMNGNIELPPVAMLPCDDKLQKLKVNIDNEKKIDLPPAPVILPAPGDPFKTQVAQLGKKNDLPESPLPAPSDPFKNQPLPMEKEKKVDLPGAPAPLPTPSDPFRKIDEAAGKAQVQVGDLKNKVGNVADNAVNKGNQLLNQTIDNAKAGLPGVQDNLNKSLENVNKNLNVPQLPMAEPKFPAVPAPNTNVLPSGPGGNNPMGSNLPGVPGPEIKAPVIPAPREPSLPAITNNNVGNGNNAGFVIPAGKPEVRVSDAKQFVARPGDTFANLSREVYGSDRYAGALLAYNRELDRNLTTLQAGQTLYFPAPEVLQQPRYAGAGQDLRTTPGFGNSVSINAPVPLNVNRTFTPTTPSRDVTKSYRIPPTGQKIYELAIQTLGDGSRWTEIYRLNPTIDPLQPIPGNSVVRLPGNANVP